MPNLFADYQTAMIMDYTIKSMTAAMLLLPPSFVTIHSTLLRELRGPHEQVISYDRHRQAHSFNVSHLRIPQMVASNSTDNYMFPELAFPPTNIIRRPFRVTQVTFIRQLSHDYDRLTTAWWQPIQISDILPPPAILDPAFEPSMDTIQPDWAP